MSDETHGVAQRGTEKKKGEDWEVSAHRSAHKRAHGGSWTVDHLGAAQKWALAKSHVHREWVGQERARAQTRIGR